MKKVVLLCSATEKHLTVSKLQELGIVHLADAERSQVDRLPNENERVALQKAIQILSEVHTENRFELDVTETVSKTISLSEERTEIQNTIGFAHTNLAFFEKWGDFDPRDLRGLVADNRFLTLVEWPVAKEIPQFDGVAVVELSADKSTRRLALFSGQEIPTDVSAVSVPDQNPAFYSAIIRDSEARLRDILAELKHLAAALFHLKKDHAVLENQAKLHKVAMEMSSAEPVSWLTGFIPSENTAKIEIAAKTNGWGLVLSDPVPEDEPPTLLRYPAFIEPVRTVLKAINILPGYDEIDAGSVFLFFFCLFFAILIGDAGYGLLFLFSTLALRALKRSIDSKIIGLLLLTSLSTVGWGILTGTWFGTTESGILEPLKLDWLSSSSNMMWLCFGIGATHLTVAHLWNAVLLAPKPAALSQLGWIALSWSMFFVAGNLVLGKATPDFLSWLLISGILLVVLFMTPLRNFKTEWYNHVMLPLSLVSNFVDVVSYLRLFAVGAASLAMAQAFNTMALEIGFSSIISGIISSLILFAGHTLNIVLGAMGILVHGVRLNTLEFSSHLGVQWKGKAYQPFRHENDFLK